MRRRCSYKNIILIGLAVFLFLIVLDNFIFKTRTPSIEKPQLDFVEEHLSVLRDRTNLNPDDVLKEENLLPLSKDVWNWFPKIGKKKGNSASEVALMKKRIDKMNRKKISQENPKLVQLVKDFWIRPPSKKKYNLEDPSTKDFSKGQSAVVDTILRQKEHGFFIECGALDGETRSNTLFFERERSWSGLLVEAGPINYKKMIKKNRKAYSSPACLGIKPFPTKMYFHRGQNRGRLIDGASALQWVRNQAMEVWLMEVQCFPLYSLMLALNRTKIDYLSLDIEGLELEVLQTIPWENVSIDVITVEFSHGENEKQRLKDFFIKKGYGLVTEITRDDLLANDLVFKKDYLGS